MKYSARSRYYMSLLLALGFLVSYVPVFKVHAVESASPTTDGTRSRAGQEAQAAPDAAARTALEQRAREAHAKVPLYFEANRGQFDPQVSFVSRGVGYKTFLTPTEAAFVLRPPNAQQEAETLPDLGNAQANKLMRAAHGKQKVQQTEPGVVVRMKMSGANAVPLVAGVEQLPGRINYFRSSNPDTWVTNVPTYGRVQYSGVYPGIDMVYYGAERQLEYDFVVAPGADPSLISFNIEGAESISVDAKTGDLVMRVKGGGELRQRKPLIFQQIQNSKQPVSGGFTVNGKSVGFSVGDYNPAHTLIIDPVFSYSTFLGGSDDSDEGYDIAVDADGNAYVTGFTRADDFPTKNAIQPGNHGNTEDAFITKLDSTGSQLIWSTYLGGGSGVGEEGGSYGDDGAYGIALDANRNVYVTGYTNSADFPTKNPMQPNHSNGGDGADGFVTKLNAAGDQLVFSTYLGGASGPDEGRSIAVGQDNSVYVAGVTGSYNFPTTNPIQFFNGAKTFQESINNSVSIAICCDACSCDPTNNTDAFLTKLAPDGQTRAYSTFLGGNNAEYGLGVAVDSDGNAYITGWTDSTDFDPTGAPTPTPDANISEFQLPTHLSSGPLGTTSGPFSITGGSDSNLWFTELLTSKIGRITPTGTPIAEFNLSVNAFPLGIAAGPTPDANLWAAEDGIDRIARMTPAGVANEFPLPSPTQSPTPQRGPADITQGPVGDTNLWFTELNVPEIGRISPLGVVTHFPTALPGPGTPATGITNGPDGNLWYTLPDTNQIGRMTVSGVPLPPFSASAPSDTNTDRKPSLIVAGSDGNIWFTEQGADQIGRISPLGALNHFTIPSGASAFNITSGPDGNIWFTIPGKSLLGRINPADAGHGITEFQAPVGSVPLGITSGSDGNIWFTEFLFNRIGRFALNPATPPAPVLASPLATPTPFPTTAGAFQSGPGGNGFGRDAFVTKVNAAGSALVYSTYLGGARDDEAYDIAIGPVNTAYVTGYTRSKNAPPPNPEASPTPNRGQVGFPVTEHAFQKDNNGGTDAFVTRLNSDGSGLVYSTYLGGGDREGHTTDESFGSGYDGAAIAVDLAGNAYVTGFTASTFVEPTPTPSPTPTPTPAPDALRAAAPPSAAPSLVNTNFPTKEAVQPEPGSDPGDRSRDAYVAKFNTSAEDDDSLIYSTFLGGDNRDEGLGIAVDLSGNAYVTGYTVSAKECVPRPVDINNPDGPTVCEGDEFVDEFPTTHGAFQETPPGGAEGRDRQAFVTKIGGGTSNSGGGGEDTGEFSIAGRVTDSNGVGVSSVTLTLTKADNSTRTTITDANGFYAFDGLEAGNYTVTPTATGMSFLPPSRSVTIINQNERADFQVARTNLTLSGRVTDQNGNGVPDVTITVTLEGTTACPVPTPTPSPTPGATPSPTPTPGATPSPTPSTASPVTVTTDSSGNYTVTELTEGNTYRVTPSRPNFTFQPLFTDVPLCQSATGINFTAVPGTVSFESASSSRNENGRSFQITVSRTQPTGETDVDYATFDGAVTSPTPSPSPGPNAALEHSDYITSLGHLHFDVGQTTQTVTVFIVDDNFVEGNEVLSLVLNNPTNGVALGAPSIALLTIVDNDPAPSALNPIDDTAFFVRQQYLDFLNREPDDAGLAFWSNEIDKCTNPANRGFGETEAQCFERKRVQVSKAFFLSIEFQETGFFVIRSYRAALDRYPEFREFLRDTQEVQRGVVVGQAGFQEQLENNRAAYLREFVLRPDFLAHYPETQTRDQYIDALFDSADFTPTAAERQQVSDAYDSGGTDQTASRASALRALADLTRFRQREFNPAFVMMEYIGYLRRNPDEPGFNFWLGVLMANDDQNQMVRAFIVSGEYRNRFGQ